MVQKASIPIPAAVRAVGYSCQLKLFLAQCRLRLTAAQVNLPTAAAAAGAGLPLIWQRTTSPAAFLHTAGQVPFTVAPEPSIHFRAVTPVACSPSITAATPAPTR